VDRHDEPCGNEEPEATAGELAHRCTLCRAEIVSEFFSLRGLSVCPACAEGIRNRQAGRGNRRRALLFGAVAAATMALLWFLATVATSRQLSIVAVLAGIVIGLAVHQGSGGHGGFRYQLTAMLLVYAAFVVRFVPPVFGGIAEAIKKDHAASMAPSRTPIAPPQVKDPPAAAVPAAAPTTSAQAAATPTEPPSTMATLKSYFVFTAIAWGLVLASPFMPSTTSLLSLLSLAVGMGLAFRLNRRVRLWGPFQG
jgi:hypothetical protein